MRRRISTMSIDFSASNRLSTHFCVLCIFAVLDLITLRLPRVCAISPSGEIHFSKTEAKEFSEDMLSVFDLDPELNSNSRATHRPWNKNEQSSAPMFMKDVYKELDQMDSVYGNSFHYRDVSQPVTWRNSPLRQRYNVSSWIESSLLAADYIVSVPQDEDFKGVSFEDRHRRLVFKFDHLDTHRQLTVIGSELRIFRHAYAYAGEHMQLVLERMRANGDSPPVAVQTITKDLIPGQTGWIEVNITSFVKKWMDYPHNNGGIYIRLLNAKGRDLPLGLLGFETRPGQSFSPFVVASYESGSEIVPKRVKRSVNRRRNKRNRRNRHRYKYRYYGHCSRHSFVVDFKALHWDTWIIAPQAYNAYVCLGDCPIQSLLKLRTTNHSIMQTMLRYKNQGNSRRKEIPPTCCVPTELQPLKLLYFKDLRVILRRYKNMVVKSCGCY